MMMEVILDEQGVLNLIEDINNKGIVNLRYYLNEELESNYTKFIKKLKVIKVKYPDVYTNFIDNINNNYEKFKETAKSTFIYMSNLIKQGILLDDGTVRPFDLFDYYILKNKYFENFSKKDLIPILEELKKEYRGTILNIEKEDEIRIFMNSDTPKSENAYFVCPISKNTIISAQDELNIEEKEYLVKFMEENNVTFNYGNYRFGVMKMLQQRNTSNNLFDLNMQLNNQTNTRKK